MPLSVRLLSYLTANLVLVVIGLLFLLPQNFQIGWSLLLTGSARERLQGVAETIADDMGPTLGKGWRVDLQRFNDLHGMTFAIFDGNGNELAGDGSVLPRDILREVRNSFSLVQTDKPGAPGAGALPPRANDTPGASPHIAGWPIPDRNVLKRWIFVVRPSMTDGYWLGVRVPISASDGTLIPATVLARSDSAWRMAMFIGVGDWLAGIALLLVLSLLAWFFLLRILSQEIDDLAMATAQIANGRFDIRPNARRNDELGRLAHGLGIVAERLDHFLQNQKHFLANIAHEVASPLARLRLSLDLLEPQLQEQGRAAYTDVQEEVLLMSELVSELLAFSRVGIGEQGLKTTTIALRPFIHSVLDRENAGKGVRIAVESSISVQANPSMLMVALGNLVRNALRYAGTDNGPVDIQAQLDGAHVYIRVMDRGPGVPELALLKLGDPFYRPEVSRNRLTGGLGLGLATVRNCVAACGGQVSFRNREEGGFEAEIQLSAAE